MFSHRVYLMLLAALVSLSCQVSFAEEPKKAADSLVVYQGAAGPGLGKHIVLVSGDEEYRSEEALPQLGKILAKHHGFTCTVLFAIDLKTGLINPNQNDNIPGLENLAKADLMIIGTRMRKLPPEQMKPIEDYLLAGKPVIGLRTATHAFLFSKEHPFARYGNGYRGESKEWEGGFGRLVLGEMWINHHGSHGKESCRGVLAPMKESHPIVKGIQDGDIWGPTDVYGVRLPLPDDSQPLILGQVLNGMKSTDKPVEGKKNDPMMPVAWVKSYQLPGGKKGKSFNTTMGASQDFESEGLRRLVVNASYWCLDMGAKVPEKSKVDLVGKYEPTRFSFNGHKKGMKPSDFAGLD